VINDTDIVTIHYPDCSKWHTKTVSFIFRRSRCDHSVYYFHN